MSFVRIFCLFSRKSAVGDVRHGRRRRPVVVLEAKTRRVAHDGSVVVVVGGIRKFCNFGVV